MKPPPSLPPSLSPGFPLGYLPSLFPYVVSSPWDNCYLSQSCSHSPCSQILRDTLYCFIFQLLFTLSFQTLFPSFSPPVRWGTYQGLRCWTLASMLARLSPRLQPPGQAGLPGTSPYLNETTWSWWITSITHLCKQIKNQEPLMVPPSTPSVFLFSPLLAPT